MVCVLQVIPPGFDPEMFKQMQMMATLLALQQGAATPGPTAAAVPPLKAKAGWEKLVDATKTSIIDRVSPIVMRLCRANRDRLKTESKVASSANRLSLGVGGAELVLPGMTSSIVTRTSAVDDELWSALNAFFRLFAIMASMAEDEFPRQGLSEFLNMWSNLWDYTRGTRLGKIKAATAFYDENASTLGDGTWEQTFKSDSLFLFAHLDGKNPPVCRTCHGSGEHVEHPLTGRPPNPNNPRDSGRDRGKGAGDKRKARPTKPAWPCMSMLKKGVSCNRASCPFDHPACVSCGKGCASANVCDDWSQAKVDLTWADAISKIEGSKRRRTPRS